MLSSLEEELRRLRNRLALKSCVAQYSVFKDEEMEQLLRKKPKTIEELSSIKGFPKDGSRVSRWGQDIIKVFQHKDSTSGKTNKLEI